jgi:Protein of unknown function (DUF3108)
MYYQKTTSAAFRSVGFALTMLAGLCLAGGIAPAEAKPVKLVYVGYLGGLPFLSLSARVELPQGADAQAGLGSGVYRVSANVATEGNFAFLYPYRAEIASSGALKTEQVSPRQYRSNTTTRGRAETVTLSYGKSGRVSILAQPLTRQAQQAAAKGYANGTLDPAGAIVALVASFAQRHSCQGRLKLFDGARRYDLELGQVGFVDLNPLPRSYYAGSATECSVVPRLIAGFSQAAMQSQLYPRSARLFLAPAAPNLPAIPVRVEAMSALGPLLLDLVEIQF